MRSTPSAAAPEVAREHYYSRAYNSKERICSFWHQVDEVLEMEADDALEIGPGSGFVTNWLRKAGVRVTTLDLDPELKPDLIGSVTDIPLGDDEVDAAVCCQVLEHLPFEQAAPALAELGRVTRKGVVISLPDVRPWLGVAYPLYFGLYADQVRQRLPRGVVAVARALLRGEIGLGEYLFARFVPWRWGLGGRVFELNRPPIPHGPLTTGDFEQGEAHCYEIGMEGYPLERITGAIAKAGLEMVKDFRVPENPWHHFFVLRSKV
jgi:SAM-dependent methyltransferase